MSDKLRVFVDMDGTMATWKPATFEELLEEGYFRALPKNDNVVAAVKLLCKRTDMEVFSLSACLKESKTAMKEKLEWLDSNVPDIDAEHRLFCDTETPKSIIVPGGIRETDILLDDYSKNLFDWYQSGSGGKALKLLNDINATKGTWKGAKISMHDSPVNIVRAILKLAHGTN